MKRIGIGLLCGALCLSLCACSLKGETNMPPENSPITTVEPLESPYAVPVESPALPSEARPLRAVTYPQGTDAEDYESYHRIRENNPVTEAAENAISRFSYQAAAKLLKAGEDGNLSPLSLYYALAMAAVGAKGDTQTELMSLLGAENLDALKTQCGNLYRLLYQDNDVTKLKIANSVWANQMAKLSPAFYEAAAQAFYAEAYQRDFAKGETGKEIGKWIAHHTNGTLEPEIKVNPGQLLHLINTVYFYDEWINNFPESNTAPDTFHGAGGDITVDFMNRTSMDSFEKGDGYTKSAMRLKGGGQMVFVLPQEGTGVESLYQSPERLQTVIEREMNAHGNVVWKMPKFTIDAEYDCREALEAMGLKTAFTKDADFSGMTDEKAWIDGVLQGTHIAVNEKGVEASAYTDLMFAGSAMPEDEADMILDRPFLYAIVQEGIPLFIGVYQGVK